MLERFQSGANHLTLPRGERVLYRDDELRNDGEDLSGSVLQHVVDPLSREELVRMFCLTETLKEERQVVMVVQLLDLDLPSDFVPLRVVLQGDGEVTSVVEFLESGLFRVPFRKSAGSWRGDNFHILYGRLYGKARRLQWLLVAGGLCHFVCRLEWERFGQDGGCHFLV